MGDDTKIPSDNVLPFPLESCKRSSASGDNVAAEGSDHGPSPEESLRIMRAFVGIKNRKLRENVIEMLEDASHARAPMPGPSSD
jgi:hypothetical protein